MDARSAQNVSRASMLRLTATTRASTASLTTAITSASPTARTIATLNATTGPRTKLVQVRVSSTHLTAVCPSGSVPGRHALFRATRAPRSNSAHLYGVRGAVASRARITSGSVRQRATCLLVPSIVFGARGAAGVLSMAAVLHQEAVLPEDAATLASDKAARDAATMVFCARRRLEHARGHCSKSCGGYRIPLPHIPQHYRRQSTAPKIAAVSPQNTPSFASAALSPAVGGYGHSKVCNNNGQCHFAAKLCTGQARDTKACNEHDCPIDCVVEEWDNWGTCTRDGITAVTCNKGRQTRTRPLTPPRYGGKKCPAASDVRDCAMQCCAGHRHTKLAEWHTSAGSDPDTCEACAPGTVTATQQLDACTDCDFGKFQDQSAQATCKNCAKGTQNPSRGATSEALHCNACAKGKYAEREATKRCDECVEGKYNNDEGQCQSDACKNCVEGQYAKSKASHVCADCQVGKYNDEDRCCLPSCKMPRWSFQSQRRANHGTQLSQLRVRALVAKGAMCPDGTFRACQYSPTTSFIKGRMARSLYARRRTTVCARQQRRSMSKTVAVQPRRQRPTEGSDTLHRRHAGKVCDRVGATSEPRMECRRAQVAAGTQFAPMPAGGLNPTKCSRNPSARTWPGRAQQWRSAAHFMRTAMSGITSNARSVRRRAS